MTKRWTPIAVVLAFGLILAGLQWLKQAPPEVAPEPPTVDTGMSEAQREAFMRTIGYVQ